MPAVVWLAAAPSAFSVGAQIAAEESEIAATGDTTCDMTASAGSTAQEISEIAGTTAEEMQAEEIGGSEENAYGMLREDRKYSADYSVETVGREFDPGDLPAQEEILTVPLQEIPVVVQDRQDVSSTDENTGIIQRESTDSIDFFRDYTDREAADNLSTDENFAGKESQNTKVDFSAERKEEAGVIRGESSVELSYSYAPETISLLSSKYIRKPEDIRIYESCGRIPVRSTAYITCGRSCKILKNGTEYSIIRKETAAGRLNEYRIFAANFAQEGSYSVTIRSVFEDGSVGTNSIKCSPLREEVGSPDNNGTEEVSFSPGFIVDGTDPSCRIAGLQKDREVRIGEKITLSVIPEDNIGVASVAVRLEEAGDETELLYEGRELAEVLGENKGSIPVQIAASHSAQTLTVTVTDNAGNTCTAKSGEIRLRKDQSGLYIFLLLVTAAAAGAAAMIRKKK